MSHISFLDTAAVNHGPTSVRRVYHGDKLIWPAPPAPAAVDVGIDRMGTTGPVLRTNVGGMSGQVWVDGAQITPWPGAEYEWNIPDDAMTDVLHHLQIRAWDSATGWWKVWDFYAKHNLWGTFIVTADGAKITYMLKDASQYGVMYVGQDDRQVATKTTGPLMTTGPDTLYVDSLGEHKVWYNVAQTRGSDPAIEIPVQVHLAPPPTTEALSVSIDNQRTQHLIYGTSSAQWVSVKYASGHHMNTHHVLVAPDGRFEHMAINPDIPGRVDVADKDPSGLWRVQIGMLL